MDTAGVVVTDFYGGWDSAQDLQIQADGRIVMGGEANESGKGIARSNPREFGILRYNTDGSLDSSFDGDGKVLTPISEGQDIVYGLAIQDDQKVVAAGRADGNKPKRNTSAPSNFAIARYNPNGSLDSSFDGDGKVLTLLGTSSFAQDVVVQPNDQRIVVAGSATAPNPRFAVARYNTNGSLDSSFGGGGIVTTAFAAGDSYARGVAIQSDGKIVVSGEGGANFRVLARYNVDGSLDANFDGDGKVEHAFSEFAGGTDLVIQADGKILVCSSTYVTRYNSDGSIDTSFASSGVLTHSHSVRSIVLQPDQKILVGGGSSGILAVSRLQPDGSLDATFGSGGTAQVAIANASARAIGLQADGKVILGGTLSDDNATSPNHNYISVRFNSDGTLDTTWGGPTAASTSSATLASTALGGGQIIIHKGDTQSVTMLNTTAIAAAESKIVETGKQNTAAIREAKIRDKLIGALDRRVAESLARDWWFGTLGENENRLPISQRSRTMFRVR